MPTYFLYIDESKDYKNHKLYIGWILSDHWLSSCEKMCQNLLPRDIPYELKSTRPNDREIFQKTWKNNSLTEIFVTQVFARSDEDYLTNLIESVSQLLSKKPSTHALDIFADFTRLSDDMKKVENAFSKKLTHHFSIPVRLEFKNSRYYRCIQYADLAVGCFRRNN